MFNLREMKVEKMSKLDSRDDSVVFVLTVISMEFEERGLFALFLVRTVHCEHSDRANSEHVCSQYGGPCRR